MSDKKISELADGVTLQATDELVVARSGQNYKIPGSAISGGSSALRLYSFAFAFDTPGLNDGVTAYTPTVGDVLLESWYSVSTAFNGTTPLLEIGQFVGTTTGFWFTEAGDSVHNDLSLADVELAGTGYLMGNENNFWQQLTLLGFRTAPGRFTSTSPLKVVVSQDATKGGAAIGGTAGAATLYMLVATASTSPG